MQQHHKSIFSALAGGAGFIALLAVQPAVAQQSAQAEAGDASGGIEEIVVTAEKRETTVQKTPISIEVMTPAALEAQHVTDVRSIAGSIPNLTFAAPATNNASQLNVSLRGITNVSGGLSGSFDAAVGVSIDGVYFGVFNGLANIEWPDLERIEVLRGPQGTLQGRNTTAGAINFYTRRPDLTEFNGEASVEVGNFGHWKTTAIVNTPLSDTFAVKVTGLIDKSDGYVKNIGAAQDQYKYFGSTDNNDFKVDARWRPAENLTIDYTYWWIGSFPSPLYLQTLNNLPAASISNVAGNAAFTSSLVDPRNPVQVFPVGSTQRLSEGGYNFPIGKSISRLHGHNLTLNWDVLDHLTVRSITGYMDNYSGSEEQLTGGIAPSSPYGTPNFTLRPTPVAFPPPNVSGGAFGQEVGYQSYLPTPAYFIGTQRTKERQISQEINFLGDVDEDWIGSSVLPGKIQYTAGLFYFDSPSNYINVGSFNGGYATLLPVPAVAGCNTCGTYWSSTSVYTNQTVSAVSKAVFAQGTYTPEVWDERLHLTVGARYTMDDKSVYCLCAASGATLPASFALPASVQPAFVASVKQSWHSFNPTITLAADLTDDIHAYVKRATGYRGGAFNGQPIALNDVVIPSLVVRGVTAPAVTVPGFSRGINPEQVHSYEVGAKGDFFDNKLRVQAAAFWTTVIGPQIGVTVLQQDATVCSGCLFSSYTNSGQEDLRGVELNVQAEILDGLVAGLDTGYTYWGYSDLKDLLGKPIIPFNATGQNKQLTADLSLSYTVATENIVKQDLGKLNVTANYNWTGKRRGYGPYPLGPTDEVWSSPFGVLNASINLSQIPFAPGAKLTLYCKNCGDRAYYAGVASRGSPYALFGTATWAEPATYGASVRYDF